MKKYGEFILLILSVSILLWIKLNHKKTKNYYTEDYIKIVYYEKICDCDAQYIIHKNDLIIKDGYFIFKNKNIKSDKIKVYCKL